MVGQVVFHIGDSKTGSTSIQRTLALGAATSAEVSLLYPLLRTHAHHAVALSLYDPAHMAERARHWRWVAERLAGSDADVAVISAELFENVAPATLAEAIAEFLPEHLATARFVAYVRPHAERVLSAWTQQVKTGTTLRDLEGFHRHSSRRGRFLYAPRFEAWRAAFGARFVLRPMIRAELAGGDVVRDFCEVVFAGAPFELTLPPPANEALCLEDLALLNALQQRLRERLGQDMLRKALGGRLAQLLQAAPPRSRQTRPQLHRSLAIEIAETYGADAAALDASFFAGQAPAGPMTRALEAAIARALPEPLPFDPSRLLTPAEARLARCLEALVVEMVAERPEGVRQLLRARKIDALMGV